MEQGASQAMLHFIFIIVCPTRWSLESIVVCVILARAEWLFTSACHPRRKEKATTKQSLYTMLCVSFDCKLLGFSKVNCLQFEQGTRSHANIPIKSANSKGVTGATLTFQAIKVSFVVEHTARM